MKFVDQSTQRRISRDKALQQEITRIRFQMLFVDKIKIDTTWDIAYWPEAKKRGFIDMMNERNKQIADEAKQLLAKSENAQRKAKYRDAGFQCFSQLPTELRDEIWKLAMEDQLKPRVHCIDEKRGQFISNQPVSPLLATCRESRRHYLQTTWHHYAFGTYINFVTDIIYITFFKNEQIWSRDMNLWEDVSGMTEPVWHVEPAFRRFLLCNDSEFIVNLAMPYWFWRFLPIKGGFEARHVDLRGELINYNETIIVFDDKRPDTAKWLGTNANMKDINARQKRNNGNMGYAVKAAKNLEQQLNDQEGWENTNMNYRFCLVEEDKSKLA